MVIGGHGIIEDGERLIWTAGASIDCDGCATAYAPEGSGLVGLDYLSNAGFDGNWCGLVTNSDGTRVVQGITDPAPGYYISQTKLQDTRFVVTDPRRYADSNKVRYLSVPPELMQQLGVKMGDVAFILNLANGASCSAVVAERGPHRKIGEISMASARELGLSDSPKHGGTDQGIQYTLYRNSQHGWWRSMDDIAAQVEALRSVRVV